VPLFVFDAGYDPFAISHELADIKAEVLCRHPRRPGLLFRPSTAPQTTAAYGRTSTTTRERFKCSEPATWPAPSASLLPRCPPRHDHRCLARAEPPADPARAVGRPTCTADREGDGHPRGRRAPTQADGADEEDAVAVVVGSR
jgi:hypothetical protein